MQSAAADTLGRGQKLPCKFPLLCCELSGEPSAPSEKVTGRSDAPHLEHSDCDAADWARLVNRPKRFPLGSSELADPTLIEFIRSSMTQGFQHRRNFLVSASHYVSL